jgi:signal peptidase I
VTSQWKAFFFPDVNRAFIFRLLTVTLSAAVLFGFVLIPFRIQGHSMAPTYRDGEFNFCNRLQFIFSGPQQRDVVAIRLAGQSIMLLKRVVALEGDVVEFRQGRLFVNNKPVDEPYVLEPFAWDLASRTVDRGHVYVVGDNRRVPMHVHQFGQTSLDRVIGGPLW